MFLELIACGVILSILPIELALLKRKKLSSGIYWIDQELQLGVCLLQSAEIPVFDVVWTEDVLHLSDHISQSCTVLIISQFGVSLRVYMSTRL